MSIQELISSNPIKTFATIITLSIIICLTLLYIIIFTDKYFAVALGPVKFETFNHKIKQNYIDQREKEALDIITSFSNSIDVPILIYKKMGDNLNIVSTNDAAAKLFCKDKEWKTPVSLAVTYAVIENMIDNYQEYSMKQHGRIKQVLTNGHKQFSKSALHPYYRGDWYKTSTSFNFLKHEYWVVRFSPTDKAP